MALVMCQVDSYRKQLESVRVVSCDEYVVAVKSETKGDKKKKKKKKQSNVSTASSSKKKYIVRLSDTIMFPEGGGQPSDLGTIDEVTVEHVFRDPKDGHVYHVTSEPLPVESLVTCRVDWKRRFDHMQQHTAQHLISAVASKLYGYKTVSWTLTPFDQDVMVCMGASKKELEECTERLEAVVNEKIRSALRIDSRQMSVADMQTDPELLRASSKHFPEDLKQVRIVRIEDTDANPCCGTHVNNLGHLQCIKITGVVKKGASAALLFRAGNRALHALGSCLEREVAMTSMLSSGSDRHVARIQGLLTSNRQLQQELKALKIELAGSVAKRLVESAAASSTCVALHREDDDVDFLRRVASLCVDDIKKTESVFFGTTRSKDSSNSGRFMIVGRPDIVTEIGPEAASVMGGRGGGGKNGIFQGKASNIARISDVEMAIKTSLQKRIK